MSCLDTEQRTNYVLQVFEEELTGVKEPKLLSNARLRLLQGVSSNRAITYRYRHVELTVVSRIWMNLRGSSISRENRMRTLLEMKKIQHHGMNSMFLLRFDTLLPLFMQIRVLRQLCTWQLINAERFRERANVKDSEQLEWVSSNRCSADCSVSTQQGSMQKEIRTISSTIIGYITATPLSFPKINPRERDFEERNENVELEESNRKNQNLLPQQMELMKWTKTLHGMFNVSRWTIILPSLHD